MTTSLDRIIKTICTNGTPVTRDLALEILATYNEEGLPTTLKKYSIDRRLVCILNKIGTNRLKSNADLYKMNDIIREHNKFNKPTENSLRKNSAFVKIVLELYDNNKNAMKITKMLKELKMGGNLNANYKSINYNAVRRILKNNKRLLGGGREKNEETENHSKEYLTAIVQERSVKPTEHSDITKLMVETATTAQKNAVYITLLNFETRKTNEICKILGKQYSPEFVRAVARKYNTELKD